MRFLSVVWTYQTTEFVHSFSNQHQGLHFINDFQKKLSIFSTSMFLRTPPIGYRQSILTIALLRTYIICGHLVLHTDTWEQTKKHIDCTSETPVWIRPWILLLSVLTTLQTHFPVDTLSQWVFLYFMLGIAIWCSIWLNIPSTSNHIYSVQSVMLWILNSFMVSFIWLRHTWKGKWHVRSLLCFRQG